MSTLLERAGICLKHVEVDMRMASSDELYDLIPDEFKSSFKTKEDCIKAWKVAHPE